MRTGARTGEAHQAGVPRRAAEGQEAHLVAGAPCGAAAGLAGRAVVQARPGGGRAECRRLW